MDAHHGGQPSAFVRFSYLIATCASNGYGSSGHIATMAQAGYPGNEDVRLTPAGTPKEIVVKIHDDVAKAFARLYARRFDEKPAKKTFLTQCFLKRPPLMLFCQTS